MTENVSGGLSPSSVPRLYLVLLYVVSAAYGLTAYVMIVLSPLALIILAAVAFAALLTIWPIRQYGGEKPTRQDIAVAMLGHTAPGAIFGFLGILIYALMHAILWIPPLLGFEIRDPAFTAGLVSSIVVALLLGVITAGDAPDFVRKLYPNEPGHKSPYSALSLRPWARRRMLIAGGIFLALLIGLQIAYPYIIPHAYSYTNYVAPIALNIIILVMVVDLWGAKNVDLPAAKDAVISSIRTLLEAVGYTVIPQPRSGNAEVDSVIDSLDFVALRSDGALAGRIRREGEQSQADLVYEIARLEPAAWVLQDQLKAEQKVDVKLEPVLVVFGDNVPAFESSPLPAPHSVRVIRAPSEKELAKIITSDRATIVREAVKLFGSPPVPAEATASPPATASST